MELGDTTTIDPSRLIDYILFSAERTPDGDHKQQQLARDAVSHMLRKRAHDFTQTIVSHRVLLTYSYLQHNQCIATCFVPAYKERVS